VRELSQFPGCRVANEVAAEPFNHVVELQGNKPLQDWIILTAGVFKNSREGNPRWLSY
jgi:hypothetical protein